jgi:hypothetical protein
MDALVGSIFDELLAAGDNREQIDVEEREPSSITPLNSEPCLFEQAGERVACVVASMSDVMVERRHRSARHCD